MSEIRGITGLNSNSIINNTTKKTENKDFSSYLGESKSMDEIFQEASEEYNVPIELLKAVGKAESNFNAKAVSRAGAQGVMQLMPATARDLGVSDSFDAEQNIMGGAKYLSRLLKKYDNNASLALAAYNAGSGNVAKYDGIPPFKETQNYVKKVLNYMGDSNLEVLETTSTNSSKTSTASNDAGVQQYFSYTPLDVNSSADPLEILSNLFTYDDYMRFLDLFFEDTNEEENNKANNLEEEKSSPLTNNIQYNATALNLLRNQNRL